MANYSVLKAAVQAVVKTNGNQEITGANMQSTLISIINSLGTGYQFMGVATPSTSPGTPDYNVAYIGGAGTYANFGSSYTVQNGSVGVFKYNGTWTRESFAVIDDTKVNHFVYTDDARANSAIKEIYIDTSGYTGSFSLTGLRFQLFGYYSAGNALYWQLRNSNNDLLGTLNIPYREGYVYKTSSGIKIYVDCDWTEFKNNTPHQILFNLTNNCFIPRSIFIDGSVVTAKIADGAVTTPKIADGNVTTLKIADNNVTTQKIADNNVTTQKIADGSVIAQKIADGGVTNIKLSSKIYSINEEITNTGTITLDYYWNFPTNAPSYSSLPAWSYIEFNVTEGMIYKVTAYAGQNARLWTILDTNGDRIAASSDASSLGYKTEHVSVPNGGVKMIVNNLTSVSNPFKVFTESAYIDANQVWTDDISIIDYINLHEGGYNDILYGKTLVCCGDSITQGADMPADGIISTPTIDVYQSNATGDFTQQTSNVLMTYGYQIAARNRMTFYNAGISGSTMQDVTDKNGFSKANGRYTKLPNNIDYLTIWFGWNDTAYGTLGTINDSTNQSYYGGYNVVMPYLINKYPYAKIALIVPFGTDVDHREAVRLLANKWGVACFDMYQGGTPLYFGKEPSVGVEASIVTSNKAKFQANGAHPNYQGHRQLGDMLEHFLRGI